MITAARIAEIRATWSEASDPPWRVSNSHGACVCNGFGVVLDGDLSDGRKVVARARRADLVLAATARTLVPELLDELEQLQEALELYRAATTQAPAAR